MADPRLQSYLEACGADALVIADPGLVRMLAGHATEVGFGPSPFQLPALVVAAGGATAQLVCSADEAPAGDHVHAYEGFTTAPLDPAAGLARLPAIKTPAALEPGAYRDGLGVRLEQVAVITEDGSRVLSRHPLDLAARAGAGAVA